MEPKYWSLLADVVSMQENTSSSNRHQAPPSKFAFTPILNKIPLGPIVAFFLRSLSSSPFSKETPQLLSLFRKCFSSLWHLASPRIGLDVLLDCFGAYLVVLRSVLQRRTELPTTFPVNDLTRVGDIIVETYRTSLSNASSRKKVGPPRAIRQSRN